MVEKKATLIAGRLSDWSEASMVGVLGIGNGE